MLSAWWIVAILGVIVIAQLISYKQLKNQLRQSKSEIIRLGDDLFSVRKQLTEVNTRRKKLLAASTQALIIVERNFTITSANKVAKQLFGKPGRETTLMAWTRQYQLQELVERALEGEKMPPIYFSFAGRNLEAHARFIKERKETVAVALAIHDVTELQRLSRARRDFVANISHELRTPLASIQLLTETLLKGALDDPQIAPDLVNKIAAQTDILSQLAQELLDLSLIESGQTPLKMSTYSLKNLAQDQVERLTPQAERKNITLKVDISDDIQVLVDETMVGRVITNLLHNAIKFTEKGEVVITAERSNGIDSEEELEENGEEWVTVSVSDTGVGIPAEEIPRIFERFYKIDRARTRKGSGTGLGLTIAKHVIEAHGGRIWAESSEHSGTTFHFTLPVEDKIPETEKLLPA